MNNTNHLLAAKERTKAMAEVPWSCPDPQCGGFLDRQKSKRVSIDPRTGKEVGPVRTWGWVQIYAWDAIPAVGFMIGFLLCIGAGVVVQLFYPGSASLSPAARVIVSLGFGASVVVYIASQVIAQRKRKAAMARAVSYIYYRCSRCRRWWLSPGQAPTEAHDQDRERNAEGSRPA